MLTPVLVVLIEQIAKVINVTYIAPYKILNQALASGSGLDFVIAKRELLYKILGEYNNLFVIGDHCLQYNKQAIQKSRSDYAEIIAGFEVKAGRYLIYCVEYLLAIVEVDRHINDSVRFPEIAQIEHHIKKGEDFPDKVKRFGQGYVAIKQKQLRPLKRLVLARDYLYDLFCNAQQRFERLRPRLYDVELKLSQTDRKKLLADQDSEYAKMLAEVEEAYHAAMSCLSAIESIEKCLESDDVSDKLKCIDGLTFKAVAIPGSGKPSIVKTKGATTVNRHDPESSSDGEDTSLLSEPDDNIFGEMDGLYDDDEVPSSRCNTPTYFLEEVNKAGMINRKLPNDPDEQQNHKIPQKGL